MGNSPSVADGGGSPQSVPPVPVSSPPRGFQPSRSSVEPGTGEKPAAQAPLAVPQSPLRQPAQPNRIDKLMQPPSINLFRGDAVGRWTKGQLVGKGASGAVFEAVDEATGGIFCVKEIEFAEDFADNPADLQRFEALRAEVDLLKELHHPNCVRFLGIDRKGFVMYIMMEYVYGGNVQEIIRNFGALSDDTAMKFTQQIVEGLQYLHSKNIIHRDIKGANILVGVDGSIKLADFGAAKRVQNPEQLFNTLAGTPYWMAPEVVRQEGHNKPADIWSLGATVLQMITGLAPYQHLPPVPALFKIGHSNESPVAPNIRASPEVVDFIRRCLDRDLTSRATIEELRCHRWICPSSKSNQHERQINDTPPPPPSAELGSPASSPHPRATEAALARRASLRQEASQVEEENQIREFVAYLTATHAPPAAANGGGVLRSPPIMPQNNVHEMEDTSDGDDDGDDDDVEDVERADHQYHADNTGVAVEGSEDMAGHELGGASLDLDELDQQRFDDIVDNLGK